MAIKVPQNEEIFGKKVKRNRFCHPSEKRGAYTLRNEGGEELFIEMLTPA